METRIYLDIGKILTSKGLGRIKGVLGFQFRHKLFRKREEFFTSFVGEGRSWGKVGKKFLLYLALKAYFMEELFFPKLGAVGLEGIGGSSLF